MNIDYSTPIRKDICVVYCYYNPIGDKTILKNTQAFELKLKAANIPYFNAELLIGNAEPVLENPTILVKSSTPLFYKETLWNLVEAKIPDEYTKICFIDVNLKYSRPDWLDCLSLILNFYDVIQPYNSITYLDRSDSIIESSDKANNNWGIKRVIFKKIGGFIDKSVIDESLFLSAITSPDIPINFPLIEPLYNKYRESIEKFHISVRHLNCEVYSVFNGFTYDDTKLKSTLKSLNVDWNSIFTLNIDGLWELTDPVLLEEFNSIWVSPDTSPIVEPEPEPEPIIEPEPEPIPNPEIIEVTPHIPQNAVVKLLMEAQIPLVKIFIPPLSPRMKNENNRRNALALVSNFLESKR